MSYESYPVIRYVFQNCFLLDFDFSKTRTAALLDDISSMPDTSKTSTSNSSSSLNIDHLDSHQNSSRSGAATPTSNRSTSSLLEVRRKNKLLCRFLKLILGK